MRHRVSHETRDVVDVELLHQIGTMVLDRLLSDIQKTGDLSARATTDDVTENLQLARRELLVR